MSEHALSSAWVAVARHITLGLGAESYGTDIGENLLRDPDRHAMDLAAPPPPYITVSCNGDRLTRHGWLEEAPDLPAALESLARGVMGDYPSAPLLIVATADGTAYRPEVALLLRTARDGA